jgi:hypothetical protein
MANAISDYASFAWLRVMFGLDTLPTHWYLSLCVREPGEQWDGTLLQDVEPWGPDDYTGTVYARQQLNTDSSDWGVSDAGFATNLNTVTWGVPDVDWGIVTHFAMTDDPTDGNLWAFGQFSSPVNANGDAEVFLGVGDIVIALDNMVSSIAV